MTRVPSSQLQSRQSPSLSSFESNSSCTCCKCGYYYNNSEEPIEDDTDICIAEGSEFEKSKSLAKNEMSKVVWKKVKPPTDFDMSPSAVSARRTEILRGQLYFKAKCKQEDAPKGCCKGKPNGCRATYSSTLQIRR